MVSSPSAALPVAADLQSAEAAGASPESTKSLNSLIDCQPAPALRHKYRLRFAKTGLLRFISHIDLLNVFERLFRRAALPLATTQGYHPKPRVTFAQALALGVSGLNEAVELECTQAIPAAEVLERLRQNAPPGIEFLTCAALDRKAAAQVRRAFYRIVLCEPLEDLPHRAGAVCAQSECWVHRTRPQPRRINVRPYVSELNATSTEIRLALWITPNGAARPEEVAQALGVPGDAAALTMERTHLELFDELAEADRAAPVIPWLCDLTAPAGATPAAQVPHAAPQPTPLVDDPLSFDT